MNTIKVGTRTVVFSNSFFIPTGEESFFTCPIDENDTLKCKISFRNDLETEQEVLTSRIEVEFDGDIFSLVFCNFKSASGTSVAKPFVFASSNDGAEISLLARVVALKQMVQLGLQIMLEDSK